MGRCVCLNVVHLNGMWLARLKPPQKRIDTCLQRCASMGIGYYATMPSVRTGMAVGNTVWPLPLRPFSGNPSVLAPPRWEPLYGTHLCSGGNPMPTALPSDPTSLNGVLPRNGEHTFEGHMCPSCFLRAFVAYCNGHYHRRPRLMLRQRVSCSRVA